MKRIRLTESQFNKLVAKCVKKCLNESRQEEIDSDWQEIEDRTYPRGEQDFKRPWFGKYMPADVFPHSSLNHINNSEGNGAYTTMSALGCHGDKSERFSKNFRGLMKDLDWKDN